VSILLLLLVIKLDFLAMHVLGVLLVFIGNSYSIKFYGEMSLVMLKLIEFGSISIAGEGEAS
jgi:hypothetical protein